MPGALHRLRVGAVASRARPGYTPGNPTPDTRASLKSDGFTYGNSLELLPGEDTVRFVVRDNLSGKVGSISAPLKVN